MNVVALEMHNKKHSSNFSFQCARIKLWNLYIYIPQRKTTWFNSKGICSFYHDYKCSLALPLCSKPFRFLHFIIAHFSIYIFHFIKMKTIEKRKMLWPMKRAILCDVEMHFTWYVNIVSASAFIKFQRCHSYAFELSWLVWHEWTNDEWERLRESHLRCE